MEILVPISLGELYDKISILIIKQEKVTNSKKLKNIKKELEFLQNIAEEYPIDELYHTKLYTVNSLLWVIEDEIRKKEVIKQYDKEFIELARSVYFQNDKRTDIKKEINLRYNSNIIEEKQYEKY